MALLLVCPSKNPAPWQEALASVAPDIPVRVWPETGDPADITFALLWNHPAGVLDTFPNLQAISSLGAGIDHINSDTAIPSHLPVARIVDPALVQSMSEYVVTATLNDFRDFPAYRHLQSRQSWQPLQPRDIRTHRTGIMGMGMLGYDAARKLHGLGFNVEGWSRRPKSYPELNRSWAGREALPDFLSRIQTLICLLPLTPETAGILDYELFSLLPDGAYLINVARGGHLMEADLLRALDEGKLSGACLDVFENEPLPADHPFWRHPGITITPHIASITNPLTAAPQVAENYRRANAGKPLLHAVDRRQGY